MMQPAQGICGIYDSESACGYWSRAMTDVKRMPVWKNEAFLATFPHLFFGLLGALPLIPLDAISPAGQALIQQLWVLLYAGFVFFILGGINRARRRRWPDWSGSWIGYGLLLLTAGLLLVFQALPAILANRLVQIFTLAFLPIIAVIALFLAQTRRMLGLLVSQGPLLVYWQSYALEFVDPSYRAAVVGIMALLISAVVVAATRRDDWRLGAAGLMGVDLLATLAVAYLSVFHYRLPQNVDPPPASWASVSRFFASHVPMVAIVVGPLFLLAIWESGLLQRLSRRSN
jgi:hypothetical protein